MCVFANVYMFADLVYQIKYFCEKLNEMIDILQKSVYFHMYLILFYLFLLIVRLLLYCLSDICDNTQSIVIYVNVYELFIYKIFVL